MTQNTAFIVLTYYPKIAALVRLIHALRPYPTILVDNTPTFDRSVSAHFKNSNIRLESHVTLIENYRNLGYTGGVNTGLQYGYKKNYEWQVVLNDDIGLSPGSAVQFVTVLHHTPPGLAGIYPRYLDSKRWTTMVVPPADRINTSFDFLSGSFLAVHRNLIEKIGYLYEPYFIYYEETEYCQKARKAGFPLTALTLAGVKHEETAQFRQGSPVHQYYLARNHLLFVKRNAPLYVQLHEIFRMPKTLQKHYRMGEWAALRGIRDFALGRFGPQKGAL